MPATIDQAYVKTFESNIRHLAQQSETKLRGTVQERGEQSEDHDWDRLGAIEAAEKSGRLVDTPVQDAPWSDRVAVPAPFHAGDSTEQEDPSMMLADPNSNLTKTIAMAMKRKVDDRIIGATTANALDSGGNSIAYDWANQAVGAYADQISFDLVTAVQEKFLNQDIDPSVPKCAIIGPTQVRALMHEAKQTSSDFVTLQALQNLTTSGVVDNWLGFKWIMSTRLLLGADTGGGADTKDLLFYTEAALGLQVAMDIRARVAEDPSKSFAWRLYSVANMGAVRIEDEQLVVARVADTFTAP